MATDEAVTRRDLLPSLLQIESPREEAKLPVVVSTSGGVETRVFGLVYFLGAALLVDGVLHRRQ